MKYVEFIRSVESTSFHAPNQRLLHAAMGICTEVGELLELESDEHLIEEAGDLCWYIALGYDTLGLDWDVEEDVDVPMRGESPVETLMIFATELLDMIKKQIFYGRELDHQKAALTLKILRQTLNLGLDLCNEEIISIESVVEANIKKLMKRYPEKFSEAAANERDVNAEYAAMTA